MKKAKPNHLLRWLVLLIPLMLWAAMPGNAVEYEVEDTTVQMGSAYYDLTPGEEYVFFLLQTDPDQELTAEPEKVLYMDQKRADDNGMLSFLYTPNHAGPAASVLYGKDAQNRQEITWALNSDGVLTVCGNGAVRDVTARMPAPWAAVQERVQEARISSTVTGIGASAFEGCTGLQYINFYADAPAFDENCFAGVTATVFYPGDNATWTQDVLQNYGGDIRWFEVYGQIMVESIEMSETELTLNVTEEHPLTVSVLPVNASNINVRWQSSDERVATVDANGVVKALAEGTAEIVAVAADGSGVSASCVVTVEEPTEHHHTYSAEVVEPTCTEQGYTVHTCACGDSYADSYVGALGHEWDGDTCTRCGETGGESGILPGDVDNSGMVDADDAIYLLYYTLFGDGLYPVSQDCDYDGSGLVDADDAIYLLYYTLFGDMLYPLNA